jgi:hypothetical protein
MAVFRINKTDDYTIISNYHLKNKEISLRAKGLLSLMLSLPDNWDYSILGLVTLSKDGKDVVMKALNELEEFGYLVRTQTVDEKGRFAGYAYDIYETPQTEKPCPENPNTVKPNAENPYPVNQTQLNTNILNTNNIKENITLKEKGKKTRHKHGTYGRVLLTDVEYNRLLNELGEERLEKQIELLDEYIESNNNKNKYTNFNLVLRKSIKENWFNNNRSVSAQPRTKKNEPDWLENYVNKFEEGVEDL